MVFTTLGKLTFSKGHRKTQDKIEVITKNTKINFLLLPISSSFFNYICLLVLIKLKTVDKFDKLGIYLI